MSAVTPVDRARGFVEITRPLNAVFAGVLTFTGAFVGGGAFLSPQAAAAVVATVCATGAGNAVNDYFDRDVDQVNAPGRPIPRGAVSPRGALLQSAVLFAVAVAFALTLPLAAIAIAVLNLVALVTYTPLFKGRPAVGNAVVAYLGGSTFLFGGLAVGTPGPTLVLSLLAFISTFSREVVKDVEDVRGDEAADLDTLPIRIGPGPALVVAAVLLAVAIVASPLPYVLGSLGLGYLVVVAVADALFVYAAYVSFADPTAGQTHLKYGMLVAAAAFIVGRAAAFS